MPSTKAGQGWPDDQGQLKVYTTANPAAGAEFTQTVPALTRWQVIGVSAQLVTAIAVANRLPRVVVNDGTSDVLIFPAFAVQAASLTRDFTWAAGLVGSAAGSYITGSLSEKLILGPGYIIKSITESIQAADDWGVAKIVVMEWSDA